MDEFDQRKEPADLADLNFTETATAFLSRNFFNSGRR
jgi:hypothetical protein